VVQIGGAVTVVGNGPTYGRDDTTIVFDDPGLRGNEELLQVALGGGTPRLDPEAEDSVGLTVILGRDVVDGASATTTRPATSTTTGDTDTDTGVTDTDTDTDTDSGVTDTEPDSGGA
jgi:hypothetical protein